MADFASLANEVVTILQELEIAAETVGEKFLAGGPEVEDMAAESKQHVKEVNEAVTSLEVRVTQTRENMFARISSLKTKLASLHYVAYGYAVSTKQEMSGRRNKVDQLDGLLETKNAEFDSLGAEVVQKIDFAKIIMDSSNESLKEGFDKIEKQLGNNQQTLDDIATNFEHDRGEFVDFVEEHCIQDTVEYTNHAESEITEYGSNWYDEISETNKILSADLQSAVEQLQAAENASRDEIKAMVQEVEEIYDSEPIDAASKQARQSTQQMSERMQQSESSFNEAIDGFSDLLEVLRKMVS